MTYDPTADRTYWRQCDDKRVIEAGLDSNHELAIALAERLDDRADEPEYILNLIEERDELDKRCDMLRRELEELHEALKGVF